VASDVPDYALMMGVTARQKGWMSRHGHRLTEKDKDDNLISPESRWTYQEASPGVLRCLDLDEDAPLKPAGHS